jgi:ABC-2 type transport system ATP-binding protein
LTGNEVIVVSGLVKRFDDLVAVDGVSFSVRAGEVFGFLGPNGAGKTTTLSILATLLRPTSGSASVAGCDVLENPAGVRREIGIVFQESSLDIKLTARENLDFHARIYAVGDRKKRVAEMLAFMELSEWGDKLVERLSGGMRRRLEVSRALLHRPRVLFLDEPTLGLDVQNRRKIWDYLLEGARVDSTTVFLTTHDLHEAERCHRVGVIDRGRLVACGTPAELKSSLGGSVVRLRCADPEGAARTIMSTTGLEAKLEDGSVVVVVDSPGEFLPEAMRLFGDAVEKIQVEEPTLEDVFLALTGHTLRDDEERGQGAWRTAHAATARRDVR